MKKLGHPGYFANYRVCPSCKGKFTPDKKTRRLQLVGILLGLISTALTILLYLRGNKWLPPALISYVFLGVLIYWGNQRIYLVPFQPDTEKNNNT